MTAFLSIIVILFFGSEVSGLIKSTADLLKSKIDSAAKSK